MLLDVESVFALIPFKLHRSVYTHVVHASKLCERMSDEFSDVLTL